MRPRHKKQKPGRRGPGFSSSALELGRIQARRLLHRQRHIIHQESRLQRRIFRAREEHLHRLPLAGRQVDAALHVAGSLVQVRIRRRRGEDGAAAVAYLDFQSVVGARGGGFRRRYLQPERQGRAGGGRGMATCW